MNPESGHLFEQIDEITAWRDSRAPGKPIWITEFGWDSYAQPDGRKSVTYAPEASAASYLLRAIFLMQSRGIERAFAYIYRDPTDNQAYLHNLYLSSGLVTNKWETDDRKKVGWYYLATLKNILGDYVLDVVVANGPNVYHYEYKVPGTSQRAAVLWARDGERDSGYSTEYRGPAGTLVRPVDGSTSGQSAPTDGNIVISEVPVFILYDGNAPQYPGTDPVPTHVPAPGSGLLINGGFEADLDNWYFPSWFSEVVMLSWSHLRSGDQSLRLDGFSQGPYIRQDIPMAAGQRVELSGWVEVTRNESDKPLEVILVPLHQWGGEILAEPVVIASIMGVTDGWIPFSGTIVTPDRTAKLRVQIQSGHLIGTAYFDEVALHPVHDDTATSTTPTASTTPTVTPTATATCTPEPHLVPTVTLTEIPSPTAIEITRPEPRVGCW